MAIAGAKTFIFAIARPMVVSAKSFADIVAPCGYRVHEANPDRDTNSVDSRCRSLSSPEV